MKKSIVLFIFLILIGYSIYYTKQYNIQNNKKTIQTNVKEFINIGEEQEMNPKVVKVVQIDNSKTFIALFQINSRNMVGYALLEKGINKRMKIVRANYGDNKVSYSDIKTNNGKYGLITGINQNLNIDHINVGLMYEKYTFTSNVSNELYFIKYKKLPNKLTKTFPAEFICYDKNSFVLYP